MCETLRVSHSGFYGWRGRPACAQARANAKGPSVIHHSDQRSHHASLDFGKRCQEMGAPLNGHDR
jgi:transposase InsO family protein